MTEFTRPVQSYQPMIIGAIAIAVVMFMRQGLASAPSRLMSLWSPSPPARTNRPRTNHDRSFGNERADQTLRRLAAVTGTRPGVGRRPDPRADRDPNGAGKSTVMNMIGGARTRLHRGRITFRGRGHHPLARFQARRLGRRPGLSGKHPCSTSSARWKTSWSAFTSKNPWA